MISAERAPRPSAWAGCSLGPDGRVFRGAGNQSVQAGTPQPRAFRSACGTESDRTPMGGPGSGRPARCRSRGRGFRRATPRPGSAGGRFRPGDLRQRPRCPVVVCTPARERGSRSTRPVRCEPTCAPRPSPELGMGRPSRRLAGDRPVGGRRSRNHDAVGGRGRPEPFHPRKGARRAPSARTGVADLGEAVLGCRRMQSSRSS